VVAVSFVFGGMLAATVVGILLIPVTYYVVQGVREKVNALLGVKPKHPAPADQPETAKHP
jgi:hypothetical protein